LPNNVPASVFRRVEKKYLLSQEQFGEIAQELRARMKIDDYNGSTGQYSIRSLYYDTPYNSFISDSMSNPGYKEKIRIRTYGDTKPDDHVFVEIKKKINGVSNKRRCKMPLTEAYKFLENGELSHGYSGGNTQILREIHAIFRRYGANLRPSAMISYDRLAFNGIDDAGLRVSFDTNLRGRTHDFRMESGGYGDLLIEPGFVVMEVKAPNALPLWLTSILSSQQIYSRGFSKYRSVYKNMLMSKTEVSYAR
jgi:SPX domain protein involved in polyphosphate accumulation